jgi:PAS domain S-box-containing protein
MRITEAKIRQLVTKNQSIIGTVGDSIITINEKGIIDTFNPASEPIFGCKQDEVVGKNCSILMNHTDASRHNNYLSDFLRAGDKVVIGAGREVEGKKDGRVFPLHLSINKMYLDTTDSIAFVACLRDLTYSKRLQAELIFAKNTAEQSAVAKGEFLAAMSHEIRTPMNGVVGMLGLILKTDLNEDRKKKADIAQTSAEALLSIINNVLDFSKVEAGRLDLESLVFNLRTYLGDFAEAIALRTQEKILSSFLI